MTGQIKNKPQITVLCFVWLVAISIFSISVGLKLSSISGQRIVFDQAVYGSAREMIINLSSECAVDVVSFLIITIASKPYAALVISSAIISMRGVSLGMCASFCAENAVSTASVAMMISFAMVSILMLLYTVFVSRVRTEGLWRLLVYLLITGAAVILRVLPLMLI